MHVMLQLVVLTLMKRHRVVSTFTLISPLEVGRHTGGGHPLTLHGSSPHYLPVTLQAFFSVVEKGGDGRALPSSQLMSSKHMWASTGQLCLSSPAAGGYILRWWWFGLWLNRIHLS